MTERLNAGRKGQHGARTGPFFCCMAMFGTNFAYLPSLGPSSPLCESNALVRAAAGVVTATFGLQWALAREGGGVTEMIQLWVLHVGRICAESGAQADVPRIYYARYPIALWGSRSIALIFDL